MPLKSRLFQGDLNLEACLIKDAAHIVPGAAGEHVAKIQTAVSRIDGYTINSDEIRQMRYGTDTANAILSYKKKRNIINSNYQTHADNIVGKMTIASLDKEMVVFEERYVRNTPSLRAS